MDLEKGPRRSRGMTTLEKFLIFLFVAMSAVCIGLIVLYFTDKSDSSTSGEGEYVYYSMCIPYILWILFVKKNTDHENIISI